MADPQHVALAKKGPYAIARWRERHWRGRSRLDLSNAYLSRAKLPYVDLSFDDLSGADLTNADLRGADLSGADLRRAYLSRGNLSRSRLLGCNLEGAALVRANLSAAVLEEVHLSGADLSSADFSYADLRGADLSGADLSETDLSWADLSAARLTNARLTGTNLRLTNLTGADLRGAMLLGAALDRAIFSEARLERTLLGDCDASQILGLETVRHHGPSIIGLDTLSRSRGRIPGEFLRQAGVAEPLIAAQEALQLNGSHGVRNLLVGSVKDGAFVGLIEEDFKSAGFACWRLLVDDEAAMMTDENAVRRASYYDTVVFICSQNSLGSPHGWRFLQQISRKNAIALSGALVIVALDDQVYSTMTEKGAGLPKGGIVDFRGWRQEGRYKTGMASLMQAVRGGNTPLEV